MKDRFPEFYNELDFEKLWKRCIFVFDANILINLYSFPKEDYNEFINILEGISNRLWMPHQIGWEYQKNRYSGVNKSNDKHNTLKSLVKTLNSQLKTIKNSITELQVDCVNINLVNGCLDEIELNVKKMSSGIDNFEIDNFNSNDKIRDKLDSLYKKVGGEYPAPRLKELYKEAEDRYKSNIPPGFEDRNKKEGNPFGDFILWNQMMDYARDNNKSIIFITEDTKNDWWLNRKPNPYLIKEFSSTGQEFYMYSFGNFLTEAKKYLKANIKQETINKVKDTEKLRDLTDKLRSDESPSSQENDMALALEVISKEPELFRKLINPGYTLTNEDNVLLLKIMVNEPELFNKMMINSGQNVTEDNQVIIDLLSKQPNLIDIMAEELDFGTNPANEDSKAIKKEEKKITKKDNKKSSGNKSKNKRRNKKRRNKKRRNKKRRNKR